jgi:trehalose 6-phosphate phosphatase
MNDLPPLPESACLLLDLDGTLLDIAPRPDAVVVPPDLPVNLLRLRVLLNGALAVVSGRPVEQIDALLPGIPTAVAGEHGGAIRHLPQEPIERAELPELNPAWLPRAEAEAARWPGALVERKARGFVFHYRLAPEAGPALRAVAEDIIGADADRYAILAAHMAWEIKPRGADKGVAVSAILSRAPFAGRLPVYVGDDVTDEDGMRVARANGGLGYRVQEVFGDAAGVRAWLGQLARAGA